MNRRARIGLGVVVVILLAAKCMLQLPLDYMRYNPESKSGFVVNSLISKEDKAETNLVFDMSLQYIGAAAMGMREAVASMLWVRADEFFHKGEYDAIVPLVRIVTWLDPHQLDVYSTGAWHLDYNFTDSEERSDRRYIPPAIALMKEGIRNNPEIFDLYFDLGWMHYQQKIRDYNNAAEYIKLAARKPMKDPNTGAIVERPAFVDRMLAHAYEKVGKYDEAEAQWKKSLAKSEKKLKDKKNEDPSVYQEVDVCKKNWGLMCLRKAWRYGDLAAYERGIKILESLERFDPRQKVALESAKKSLAGFKAAGKMPRDIDPPVDAKFEATWKKIAPKVILIEGKLNLVPVQAYKGLASEAYTNWYEENSKQIAEGQKKYQNGCRVRILLEDADYDYWNISNETRFNWKVDKNRTVMVDDVAVLDGKFRIKIDMSKPQDAIMYPFKKDKYRLILWFNPQEAPDYIQDRIGWRGEGMTDAKYLDTKSIPGVRIIRKEFNIDKKDLL